MKINRTFSIDLSLYTQLTKTSNQSKTVCTALRNYFDQDPYNITVKDASTMFLAAKLAERDDLDPFVKRSLQLILKSDL